MRRLRIFYNNYAKLVEGSSINDGDVQERTPMSLGEKH